MTSIYDFEVKDASGKPYDLSKHKGHPVLIYNVASKCGYTKGGYETATELYNKYKNCDFTVLAFPCNQFAYREPGTGEEVQQLACKRFNAEFPIMEKIKVNGKDGHPLYKYLKHSIKGILGTTAIKWNFTAFLVDGEGHPVKRFPAGTKLSKIEKTLVTLLSHVNAQRTGTDYEVSSAVAADGKDAAAAPLAEKALPAAEAAHHGQKAEGEEAHAAAEKEEEAPAAEKEEEAPASPEEEEEEDAPAVAEAEEEEAASVEVTRATHPFQPADNDEEATGANPLSGEVEKAV